MNFAFLYSQKNQTLFQRLVAAHIDELLLSIPSYAALYFIVSQPSLSAMTTQSIIMTAYVFVPSIVLTILYRVVCTMRWGKTLGKALMGLEVVTEESKNLSFKRAFFREITGKSLTMFSFGAALLWSIYDEKSQTWYDLLAGTVVVRKHNRVLLAVCLLVVLLIAQALGLLVFISTIKNSPVFNEIASLVMSLYR